MKAPGRDVAVGPTQVKRYWEESADEATQIPAARWVLICSFQKLEIWDPGRYPANPRMTLDLADLPDHYDALNFLAGPDVEPVLVEHYRELTKQAAERIAAMYQSLIDRLAAPPDEMQHFVRQSEWCLFLEDLGMLSGYPLLSTVGELIQRGGSSAERIGFLFRVLNQKGNHNRKGVLAGDGCTDLTDSRGLGMAQGRHFEGRSLVHPDVGVHDVSVAGYRDRRTAGGGGRGVSQVVGAATGAVSAARRRADEALQRDGRGRVRAGPGSHRPGCSDSRPAAEAAATRRRS